jgi:hypothetical protein
MAPGTYGDKVGLSVGSSLEFGDLVLYHHDSEMTKKRWWIFFTPKKTQIEVARILFLIALTVLKLGIWLATASFFQINVKQSNYALDGHNQQHKKLGGTNSRCHSWTYCWLQGWGYGWRQRPVYRETWIVQLFPIVRWMIIINSIRNLGGH